jgi:hypothetical protein
VRVVELFGGPLVEEEAGLFVLPSLFVLELVVGHSIPECESVVVLIIADGQRLVLGRLFWLFCVEVVLFYFLAFETREHGRIIFYLTIIYLEQLYWLGVSWNM